MIEADLAELGVGAVCAELRALAMIPATTASMVPVEALELPPRLDRAAWYLRHYRTVMLASPDLLLTEKLAQQRYAGHLIVFAPRGLERDRSESLSNNMPRSLHVEIVTPGDEPTAVTPEDSAFATVGFVAGGGLGLIPVAAFRVLQHWKSVWSGRTILVDALGVSVKSRPPGFRVVALDAFFTHVISPTNRESEGSRR